MKLTDDQKKQIDTKVTEFLEDIGVLQDDAIDIVDVARRKDFVVQRLNMGDDTTGMLLCNEEHFIAGTNFKKLIVVKKGLPEDHSRFIVAHELGHYIFKPGNAAQISRREYSSLKVDKDEQMADCFARAILMPKKLVIDFIKYLIKENLSETEIIMKIADKFKVSEQKAKIRYLDIRRLYEQELR